MRRLILAAACLAWALPAAAQFASCTSDGQPVPVAVLERFINADCDECWRDPATPAAGKGELALDWIVPGSRGDDAPLSIGALPDGLARLQALRQPAPDRAAHLRQPRQARAPVPRVAQGQPLNDYVGTSIALKPGAGGPFTAWLLLVEELPVGAEGSPVPRNLVRNALELPWRGRAPLREARPMQIHEGTRAERLRLVGLLADARGRVVAAARSHCNAQ